MVKPTISWGERRLMQTTFETEGNISSALNGSCPNLQVEPGISSNFKSRERVLRTMDMALYRYFISVIVLCMMRLLNTQLLTVGLIFLPSNTPRGTSWAIRLIVGYRNNWSNRRRGAKIIQVYNDGPVRILRYRSGFRNKSRRHSAPMDGTKIDVETRTHLSHAERYPKTEI